MSFRFLLFILLLISTGLANGQFCKSFGTMSGKAERIKKKDHRLYPLIALGYAGLTYFTYRHLDQSIKEGWQDNRSHFQTIISRSVTDLGLGRAQSIELAAVSIIAFTLKNEKLERTVITWAGSLLLNSTLTDQLKKTFQRHRPNTGDAYNTFDWRHGPGINTSFPSGHTSNAFTTATVFAILYNDHKWVPPVAYSVAALVGLSRIYDNVHWTSDVLAGAAVGFISAQAMNFLYKWVGKKFTFLPYASKNYSSASLIWRF